MHSVLRWLAALLLLTVASPASDWPRWRGPAQDGHVPPGAAVPAKLPATPVVVWRLKIGNGLASPVVSAGLVTYLDDQQDTETVHVVEASTGKQRWSVPLDTTFKDAQSAAGPRCTPVIDGDRIYAQSCRGQLKCLNATYGTTRWSVDYVKDYAAVFIGEKGAAAGASRHGYDGSPVIDGGYLIACAGGTNGASVICLDKLTGRLIWKSQDDIPGYAPPVLAMLFGTRQVIVFTVQGVMGLEAATGRLLWRVPVKTALGRHVTTPVVIGDMVFVASHQAGLIGVKVAREQGAWSATTAWAEKALAINFSSPVAVGEYIYGLGPAKNLMCVEAASGKLAWSQAGCIATSADKAHAAFLVMGSNILSLTDSGELILFAADAREFRLISRVQVCGANWCNPAYADGKLYLRDRTELLCLGLLP
jgi:outer membrane protein assembly factor BamB